MNLATIYTSTDNRLRAGWRILLFLIIFFTFSSLILLIRPVLGDVSKKEFIENYSLLIIGLLSIGATLAVALSRKWFDKQSMVSLGLKWNRQALVDLIFGFFLSAFMAGIFFMTLILFNLIDFNGIEFHGLGFPSDQAFSWTSFMSVFTLGALLFMFLEVVFVGYWEELVFRGYLFQNMVSGMGLSIAVVVSCVLYGLVHAANPNATLLSTLIIVAFGFLRLYGYLSTKALWLSMGMHIGWNFFQGPVFGFAASGHKKATLIQHSFTSENTNLTGGDFGPEGSLLMIPIVLLALFIMKKYAASTYFKVNSNT